MMEFWFKTLIVTILSIVIVSILLNAQSKFQAEAYPKSAREQCEWAYKKAEAYAAYADSGKGLNGLGIVLEGRSFYGNISAAHSALYLACLERSK